MMKDWTYGRKLGAGVTLLSLLAVVMAFVAWRALASVVAEKDQVIQNAGQDLIDAEHLSTALYNKVANTRTYLFVGDERYWRGIEHADADFLRTLDSIRSRSVGEREANLLSQISTNQRAHAEAVRQLLERGREADSPDSVENLENTFNAEVVPRFDDLRESVKVLVENAQNRRETGSVRASATAAAARNFLAGTALFTTLAAALVGAYLTRALTKQIGESVQHIRSSSAELQAAATQQASGAREQATAMSEISTTIGELLATSRQIAESGQNVAKMASDSADSAHAGRVEVKRSLEAVEAIKLQVDAIVQHMLALGKRSQQIGGVLDIINELAEQTNILAINATIEAAGAGDAGRRFSVVGDEIRKLSDRVGSSTKEIRELIDEIRTAVNSTVMATETGAKTVDAGTKRFGELEAMFSRIAEIVAATTEAGQEIELSTKQQSTAVEQVNIAISNVAQATRETETSSEQTLQTASQLSSLSDALARFIKPETA